MVHRRGPDRLLPGGAVGHVGAQARLARADEPARHRARRCGCWPIRPHRGDRSHSAQHARGRAHNVPHDRHLDTDSYTTPNPDAQTDCHDNTSTDANTHARVHARPNPNT